MPIRFILPKRFTRAQIEWRMDELTLQFQRTHDKKLITEIADLSRMLARMQIFLNARTGSSQTVAGHL